MKKGLKYIVSTLAILLIANSFSFAQYFEVKASKDSILIGEPIELTIQYSLLNATSQLIFEEGDSLGNGFEILAVLDLGINSNIHSHAIYQHQKRIDLHSVKIKKIKEYITSDYITNAQFFLFEYF